MRTIRLKLAEGETVLIGDRHYAAGEIVHCGDERAALLLKSGQAEPADGQAVANPGANHLADAIDPAPPPGHAEQALAMADAGEVAERPGLVELAKATKAGPPKGKPSPAPRP